MRITPLTKQNFCAIPLSEVKIKGEQSEYKLYEITQNDKKFIDKLSDSINLCELMPEMPAAQIFIWNDIIQGAIKREKNGLGKTILETCNNIPCGIVNYSDEDFFKINYVATFPDKKNHRVPYAGQVLFNQIFKRFLKTDHDVIEINALKIGPFDPVSKYSKWGFSTRYDNSVLKNMLINRIGVLDTLEKQDEFIKSNIAKDKQEVNLDEVTNTDTIFL